MPAGLIVTPAFVAARLGDLTAAQSAILDGPDGLIAAASAAIEAETRRTFAPATFDEWYQWASGGDLYLRHVPVISITSVAVNRTNPTTLDPTGYWINPESDAIGVSTCGWSWGWGGWKIADTRVVYQAGYAPIDEDDPTSGIPADVKQVVVEMIRGMLTRQSGAGLKQSESLGPHSVSWAAEARMAVTDGMRMALAPYRVYRLG